MPVFRSVLHECRYARKTVLSSADSARALRFCNFLLWLVASGTVAATIPSFPDTVVTAALALASCAFEVRCLSQLQTHSDSFRSERVRVQSAVFIAACLVATQLCSRQTPDRLIYKPWFVVGSRVLLVLPDQLRFEVAWKVHAVLCTCFATIQCGKLMDGQAGMKEFVGASAKFSVLTLIPVVMVTLISELQARQRFDAEIGMSAADVGCFWSRLFKLSNMHLTDAAPSGNCSALDIAERESGY